MALKSVKKNQNTQLITSGTLPVTHRPLMSCLGGRNVIKFPSWSLHILKSDGSAMIPQPCIPANI